MTFGEYQQKAHSFSRLHEFENPADTAGAWAMSEMQETFIENGEIARFALLYGLREPDEETKAGIAKEFGDVLWFISEDATARNRSLDALAKDSLKRNGNLVTSVQEIPFTRFDMQAARKAGQFAVRNYKLESMLAEKQVLKATLHESTGYVLQRVFARLARALHAPYRQAALQMGPPGNADLDSVRAISQSRADALWVMSWVGQRVLNASLEEIAQSNLEKLTRRAANDTILAGDDPDRS